MSFQVGDILSVPLVIYTRHFFVYLGEGLTASWGLKDKKDFINNLGVVEYKSLLKCGSSYLWSKEGKLKTIKLERRTKASTELIKTKIDSIVPGLKYHLVHRNCEHFANYITGQDIRSEQSSWHLFTNHKPFTTESTIKTLKDLKSALLKCRFCGNLILWKKDFENTVLLRKLSDGYYVYHLNHWAGSQNLYVTTIPKAEDFLASYNSVCLAYYGALAGRGEILSIVRQIRGC